MADGAYTPSIKATDAAGNSTTADGTPFTVDTTAPTVTVVPVGDTQKTAAEATDAAGIITVNAETGSTSVVTFTGPNGTVTKTISNDGTAKPVVLTAADLTTLGDGAIEVSTVTTDSAGNTTTTPDTADGDFTLSTTVPVAPSVHLTTDSGSSSTDQISNFGALSITPDAGNTIGTVVATKADGSKITLTPDGSGNYVLPEGSYTHVEVTQVDGAGNVSAPADLGATIIDSTPPGATTISVGEGTSSAIPSEGKLISAAQAGDGVQVPVSLPSDVKAGDVITLTVTPPDGGTAIIVTHTVTAGEAAAPGTPVTLTVPVPTDGTGQGTYSVAGQIADAAGNSTTTNTVTFTLDTVAPAAPVVALANDTGSSATDQDSNDGTLTITPTAGNTIGTVVATKSDGSTLTISPDGSGNYILPEGVYTSVKVTQVDSAGNVSTPADLGPTTIDKAVTSLAIVITTDGNNDGQITSTEMPGGVTEVAVKVTLNDTTKVHAGDTLEITTGTGEVQSFTLTAADIANGFVTTTFPKPNEDQTLTVNAKIIDVAGNTSSAAPDSAVINTLPPGTPTVEIVADANNDGYINTTEWGSGTSNIKVNLPPPPVLAIPIVLLPWAIF